MRQFLLLFFGLIIISSCKEASKSQNNTDGTEDSSGPAYMLTTKLDSLYTMGNIIGYGVVIADSSGILYEKGFGYADKATNKGYTVNSVQNIGSVSKTFIGLGLLKAQEMGKLQLDDPVNKHLPFKVTNPSFPDVPITVRQLANHTSSIQDTDLYDQKAYVSKEIIPDSLLSVVEENFNPPDQKVSIRVFLESLLVPGGAMYSDDCYLKAKPGEKFEYSNIGATLAALVLEMATNTPFDQFTAQHVLKPLKMDSSGWSYDDINLETHSILYSNPDTEIPMYELITYPDGGLRTSSHDMGLYLTELIAAQGGNGHLLTAESYKTLFTPTLDDSHFEERDADFPYNDEYDMGVFMGYSGTGLIGHTGGDPGISSFMFFDPQAGLGQYLVINTSIINEEGVNQLFGIMQALEEFGPQLKQ